MVMKIGKFTFKQEKLYLTIELGLDNIFMYDQTRAIKQKYVSFILFIF